MLPLIEFINYDLIEGIMPERRKGRKYPEILLVKNEAEFTQFDFESQESLSRSLYSRAGEVRAAKYEENNVQQIINLYFYESSYKEGEGFLKFKTVAETMFLKKSSKFLLNKIRQKEKEYFARQMSPQAEGSAPRDEEEEDEGLLDQYAIETTERTKHEKTQLQKKIGTVFH